MKKFKLLMVLMLCFTIIPIITFGKTTFYNNKTTAIIDVEHNAIVLKTDTGLIIYKIIRETSDQSGYAKIKSGKTIYYYHILDYESDCIRLYIEDKTKITCYKGH